MNSINYPNDDKDFIVVTEPGYAQEIHIIKPYLERNDITPDVENIDENTFKIAEKIYAKRGAKVNLVRDKDGNCPVRYFNFQYENNPIIKFYNFEYGLETNSLQDTYRSEIGLTLVVWEHKHLFDTYYAERVQNNHQKIIKQN